MEKIKAIFIIEMMGKPAEYLKETLLKYIEKIEAERGIKIIGKKINPPKKIEGSELLSSFAEIEAELDTLQNLLTIIFSYLPSHIEIISPEEIKLRNFEMNGLCNDLTRRMLQYDSIAKNMIYEKKVLENQLKMQGKIPAIQEIKPKKKKSKKSGKK